MKDRVNVNIDVGSKPTLYLEICCFTNSIKRIGQLINVHNLVTQTIYSNATWGNGFLCIYLHAYIMGMLVK